MNFVDYYTELFAGTPECYAISRDWTTDTGEEKRAYLPSNYSGKKETVQNIIDEVTVGIGSAKYGAEAVKAHLTGKHFIGVYPIRSDSTVVFFALDFDKDEEVARKEAARQQTIFMVEAGIATYIERSRSGNGYHLWGFMEEPVNAGELRFALAPYIEDTDTYDRMFPNQDGTTEARPYGNLIALPLYGPKVKEHKGVFLQVSPEDNSVTLIDDQKEFLRDIVKIPTSQITELFNARTERYQPDLGGRIRKGDPEALEGIYKVLHPELGCEWVRWVIDNPSEVSEPEWYALACQFAQLNGGRDAFHEASENDPRYDPTVTDEKFDHALEQNSPHTCKVMRETLAGPSCTCDSRFSAYGVTHPYDLAKVPFYEMLELLKLEEGAQHSTEGLNEVISKVKATYKDPSLFEGIKYGIPDLDLYTELRPNDLIIAAARPGRGKTAFMIDIAYRIASDNIPVYVYSMEMGKEQFWARLLSRIAQVDGKRIAKGTLVSAEWRRILTAQRSYKKNPLPIFVDDSTYDAGEVVNKAAEQIAKYGKGIVMVDYLQMATNLPDESAYSKNSRVPRQYKLLAKGMKVTVFCLAQMNREGEDLTEDSETVDNVIEGSGKIEQYADVILFFLGLRRPGIVRRVCVIHKERHREAGYRVKLDFNQPVMTFESEGFWAARAASMSPIIQTSVKSTDFFS